MSSEEIIMKHYTLFIQKRVNLCLLSSPPCLLSPCNETVYEVWLLGLVQTDRKDKRFAGFHPVCCTLFVLCTEFLPTSCVTVGRKRPRCGIRLESDAPIFPSWTDAIREI
jgi:hypothetical protein